MPTPGAYEPLERIDPLDGGDAAERHVAQVEQVEQHALFQPVVGRRHHRVRDAVGQRHPVERGQRMARRHDHADRRLDMRDGGGARGTGQVEGADDVGILRQQFRLYPVIVGGQQREFDQRIALLIAGDGARHEVVGKAFGGGDADQPALAAAQPQHLVAQRDAFAFPAADIAEQRLARRGGADAARHADEQLHVELFLELQQLPVDRRRRDVQRFRRLADRPLADRAVEIDQSRLDKDHRRPALRTGGDRGPAGTPVTRSPVHPRTIGPWQAPWRDRRARTVLPLPSRVGRPLRKQLDHSKTAVPRPSPGYEKAFAEMSLLGRGAVAPRSSRRSVPRRCGCCRAGRRDNRSPRRG